MSAATTSNRNLVKTIPGLLISGFFLWYTFRGISATSLPISAIGLLVLLVAARSLQAPIQRLFTRLPVNPKLTKIEHWIILALDATGRLGVTGSLLLLFQTVIIWTCEGMIFA